MDQSSSTVKLQAFLAHQGVASRRASEQMIADGKVSVNGAPAHLGQRINPDKDEVKIGNKRITNARLKPMLFLVNKPVGIISTSSDELGRENVVSWFTKGYRAKHPQAQLPRLYPVGRLDAESEGLMILTNDGELTQRFTHPSFEVEKTYRITVNGQPTEKALAHLQRGVLLREGMTEPARVDVVSSNNNSTVLDVTIHEGRHHQVRRMLLRVGYEVTRLIRIQMGPYNLDELRGQPWLNVEQPKDFT